MKVGRPTKYKPEYCDLAEAILAADKTWCEVARILQVFERTLNTWRKKHPEFLQAYERGRTAGCALFLGKVRDAAWGEHQLPVNNRMIALLAVNQYGMRTSKKKVDASGTLSLADAVRRRHEAMASE